MKNWTLIALAILVTGPALYLRLMGLHPGPLSEATFFGLAILGAAFLLTWGAEVAQIDIPQSLALAFLALITVLPEYAVDLYFGWTAAKNPAYAAYAAANMTGANRLLIGIGWSMVVVLFWWKTRQKEVVLEEKEHAPELVFLGLATLYSFVIPLKGTISLVDSAFLVPMFGLYLWIASRSHPKEPELIGPPIAIAALPKLGRRLVVAFLFVFSAVVILASAEPFAEGLIATGELFHIDKFILVQWVAPLASEAPELLVAIIFTLKGNPTAALCAVISAKINQWSLLIGTLAMAYSVSLGQPGALPLDARQVEEIFLTAAQSAFAVAILLNFRMSLREATVLFVLFITQLVIPIPEVRYGFAILYLLLTVLIFVLQRERFRRLPRTVSLVINQARSPLGS